MPGIKINMATSIRRFLLYKLHLPMWALLMCLCHGGFAQTVSVAVKDDKGDPLAAATVKLMRISDSVSWNSFTNNAGIATFESAGNGMFSFTISHVSFLPIERSVMVSGLKKSFEFTMNDRLNTLGAFTVQATRPLIRQEEDKTIIDPEPMAATSSSTLEVLESTPGLYVDQDGGIFLNSTSPAVVYINGREMKMSTQDINTILRSLPPGSVEKIEVMRTPSARFDAASSGGIINIVLKKGVKIGRFGSANVGITQGKYGNQYGGFSLNNSGENTTMYLNFNYTRDNSVVWLESERKLDSVNNLDQTMRTRSQSGHPLLSFGLSWDPGKKVSVNYDGRVNYAGSNNHTLNINQIGTSETPKLFRSENTIDNGSARLNLQQDFGVMVKPDTSGNLWDTRLSYNFQHGPGNQEYITWVTYPIQNIVTGEGDLLQQRHFGTLQSDLTWMLPLKIKMETGVKESFQFFRSSSDFLLFDGCLPITDTNRTNAFRYRENIASAYLQGSRTLFWDIILKGGIRMEHTLMQGFQSLPRDTGFEVSRADWFPYLYLSRTLFRIFDVELNSYLIYRKTISRPGYQSLNPSVNYLDQFTYESGNPALKPQFTDNIEFNVSFNDMPVLAIGRNYTRDIFAAVVYQDENQPGVAVRTFDNLGNNIETYFRLMVGIPPGKKYFFAVGAQYNHNDYEGIYENEPFSYQRGGWRFFTFHSLSLARNTKLTLSGFAMYKGSYGFYEIEPFGTVNMGINQTFFDKKLQITLNCRDLFHTMKFRGTLHLGSQDAEALRYTDSRRIGISIRYNFGIKDKPEKRGMPEMEGMDT